jgi:serine/threonine-protein kinase RsbW
MWHAAGVPGKFKDGPSAEPLDMIATTDWQAGVIYTMDDMQRSVTLIVDAMRDAGFTAKEVFGARLSLEEALVNAIRHGHRGDTTKRVDVRFHVCASQLLVEIHDQGPGFDPDGLPDPLAPENLERPGGRGVFLIRQYMTWVQYNEAGNAITLCKVRSA